jgi:hypothetical protein
VTVWYGGPSFCIPDEVCMKGIELEIKLEETALAYFEITYLYLYMCADVLN